MSKLYVAYNDRIRSLLKVPRYTMQCMSVIRQCQCADSDVGTGGGGGAHIIT